MGKVINIIANVIGIALGVVFTFSLATSIGRETPTFWLFLLTIPIVWASYRVPYEGAKDNIGQISGLLIGVATAKLGQVFVWIVLKVGQGVIWLLS